jgi:hypothetical protein
MSFIGRQDRMLLIGFAVALIVVFCRHIRWLLDLAREVEQQGRNCVCLSVEAAVA